MYHFDLDEFLFKLKVFFDFEVYFFLERLLDPLRLHQMIVIQGLHGSRTLFLQLLDLILQPLNSKIDVINHSILLDLHFYHFGLVLSVPLLHQDF